MALKLADGGPVVEIKGTKFKKSGGVREQGRLVAQGTSALAPQETGLITLDPRKVGYLTMQQAAQIVPTEDMMELAREAWAAAGPKSRHWCLREVTNRLIENGYVNPERRIAGRAIEGIEVLRSHPNFVEVKGVTIASLRFLPPGTVVIYEKPQAGFSAAGHAQIMVGKGLAASDFRHDTNVYRGRPRYVAAFIPISKGNFTLDPAAKGYSLSDEELASDGSGYIPKKGSLYEQLQQKLSIAALLYSFDQGRKEYDEKQQRERKRNEKIQKEQAEANPKPSLLTVLGRT